MISIEDCIGDSRVIVERYNLLQGYLRKGRLPARDSRREACKRTRMRIA